MAGFLTGNPYLPAAGSQLIQPVAGSDCLPCATLRQALTQCGTCGGQHQPGVCPAGETPQPCAAGFCVDPASGCCESCSQLTSCPCGGHSQPCAAGETINSCGCCTPGSQQCACPAGDQNLPIGTPCPAGFSEDPLSPANCNCCKPAPTCPIGETPAPCGAGYQIDPQSGCCAPMPVEACFVCPKGLPELAAALAGQPNTCYLTAENFLPGGAALPAQMTP